MNYICVSVYYFITKGIISTNSTMAHSYTQIFNKVVRKLFLFHFGNLFSGEKVWGGLSLQKN
jgi:hypothetical protein